MPIKNTSEYRKERRVVAYLDKATKKKLVKTANNLGWKMSALMQHIINEHFGDGV